MGNKINNLRWILAGINMVFMLWIFYNGINEGFEGTLIEKLSYISLMCVLLLNVIFIVLPKKSAPKE